MFDQMPFITHHYCFGLPPIEKSRRQICLSEVTKSIVKGIGIGFLSCIGIGIGIAKTIFQVLVLVLVLLR